MTTLHCTFNLLHIIHAVYNIMALNLLARYTQDDTGYGYITYKYLRTKNLPPS